MREILSNSGDPFPFLFFLRSPVFFSLVFFFVPLFFFVPPFFSSVPYSFFPVSPFPFSALFRLFRLFPVPFFFRQHSNLLTTKEHNSKL